MSRISHVAVAALTEARLDANYYATRFLENEALLANCGLRRERVQSISALCNCGATPVDVSYSNDGLGLVRTSDVRPNQFKSDGVLRTNDLALSELRESVVARPGDLLFTMSGTIGYACVIPEHERPVSFSNTIARVRLPAETGNDSRYIAAFFNCRYGYEQSLRLVSGGIQGHVMPNPFKELMVVLPQAGAQRYIGGKVRQAERLTSWASKVQASSAGSMPNMSADIQRHAGRSYSVPVSSLTASRLDSQFFHPDHRALDEAIRRTGFQTLESIAVGVKAGWVKKDEGTFLYYEIGGLDVGNGTITPTETKTVDAPSRATTAVQQGDVLVSTVRPNRRNVGFVVESSGDRPMVATSGFSVLRFASLEDAAFYHAWLRTEDATSQLLRWNSGSAYPAIDEDVPLSLLVPDFNQSHRGDIGRRLLDAQYALWLSAKLTTAAKLLVEALIEGRLDEVDLVTAQSLLDAGSVEGDRDVLRRLQVTGLDGIERPLLSDFDQLYDLLDRASRD